MTNLFLPNRSPGLTIYYLEKPNGDRVYWDAANTFNIQDHGNDPRWSALQAEIDNNDHTVIDYLTTQACIDAVADLVTLDAPQE